MMAYTYWRTLPLLALHFFWPPLLPLLRYDMLLQSRCAGNHAWAQQGTQVCSHRFWRHPVREEALSSLDMYARSVCCKKQCRWRYIPDNRRTEVVIVSAIVLVRVLVLWAAIFVGWRWGSYQVYSTVSSYIYIYIQRPPMIWSRLIRRYAVSHIIRSGHRPTRIMHDKATFCLDLQSVLWYCCLSWSHA